MSKQFQIKLNSIDLGQLLDGIEMRAESWERTADYLESGYVPDGFIVEECSDADEAKNIAVHYRSMCQDIRKQIQEQGGW